jgi:hypothetical protein
MANQTHSLAPGCLFNPHEALFGIEYRAVENEPGFTVKPVPHNALKLAKLREYSDVFAPAVFVFSYGSLFNNYGNIEDKLSIYKKPCLIHEMGIFDSYLNLDLEKRYEGTRIGPDLFSAARKHMKEMGVLGNAPLYYRNSCKWMRQHIKFSMEKSRRFNKISGYDFLGAIDCHWHRTGYAVGILNEFLELKVGFHAEDIRHYNGENVILCDAAHSRNLSPCHFQQRLKFCCLL